MDNFRSLKSWGEKLRRNKLYLRQDKGQVNCAEAFINSLSNNQQSPIPFNEILEVHKFLLGIQK